MIMDNVLICILVYQMVSRSFRLSAKAFPDPNFKETLQCALQKYEQADTVVSKMLLMQILRRLEGIDVTADRSLRSKVTQGQHHLEMRVPTVSTRGVDVMR